MRAAELGSRAAGSVDSSGIAERFGRTITIEPNASLRSELKRDCPAAEVVPERILDAKVGGGR